MSDHFEDHAHEALDHSHRHFHVTHNMSAGGFEHLSSEHDHEHDHAALRHAHRPHEDFEREHGGEAHVHDHVEPARKTATRKTKTAAAAAEDGATAKQPGARPATRRAAVRTNAS
ncbi:MAG: hypothetical protein ACRDZ3_05735 [Acidimicrobiia bacterium]